MLMLPPSTRIFLCAAAADMRRSFDGLAAIARDVIGEDPLSGHLFCFTNKRRTRLKVMYFDGSGLWVMAKRLEKGTFAWPSTVDGTRRVVMPHDELTALLGGLDFARASRRSWWRRDPNFEKECV